MEIKEAIKVFEQRIKWNEQSISQTGDPNGFMRNENSAYALAISKLSLLAQVERGGVKKRTDENKFWVDIVGWVNMNTPFNEALELCQADLVRRLEGIKPLLIDLFGKNQYERLSKMQAVEHINQALITHLTGEKKGEHR